MKFVIATEVLNYLVSMCQNMVTQRSTLPVLANLLIEAKNGELTITATDLTVAVQCFTQAKVLEEGVTTLPAKKFASLIRELSAANVEITTNANEVAEIIADSSRFKLNGMGCGDYPPFPEYNEGVEIILPQEKLKEMFYHTHFSVSKEDGRYTMSGVFLKVEKGRLSMTGADGKRLAMTFHDITVDPAFSATYILPMKAVDALINNLDDDSDVSLYLMEDKIGVKTDNMTLVTKLLVGEFPDFRAVIPEKAETSLSLHREELLSLLRQVSLFTADATNSVKFSFADGELKLAANTMEIGEGKVSMPVNYHGPQLDIAFNPVYCMDILRHIKGETVTLGIVDTFNPGVLTGAESLQTPVLETPNLFVMMPMRLNEV